MINIDQKPSLFLTFNAKVLNGSITHSALQKLEGRDLKITATTARKTRSLQANAMLWALYRDIMTGLRKKYIDIGQACPIADEDQLHDAMKLLYLDPDVTTLWDGTKLSGPPRSSKLDSQQFSSYVQRVIDWGFDHEIYVSFGEET